MLIGALNFAHCTGRSFAKRMEKVRGWTNEVATGPHFLRIFQSWVVFLGGSLVGGARQRRRGRLRVEIFLWNAFENSHIGHRKEPASCGPRCSWKENTCWQKDRHTNKSELGEGGWIRRVREFWMPKSPELGGMSESEKCSAFKRERGREMRMGGLYVGFRIYLSQIATWKRLRSEKNVF